MITQAAAEIRLKHMGKIHAPHYRVIVVNPRKKRDGRVVEEIGKYYPIENPSLIKTGSDRVQYWLFVGARSTEPAFVQLEVTDGWQKFKGLPGSEDHLKVRESVDVERTREATVESVQNEAEKRHVAAVEVETAVETVAAEAVKESAGGA